MYYIMSSLPPLNYTADYFQFFGLSPGGLAHGGKDADYQVGGVCGWVQGCVWGCVCGGGSVCHIYQHVSHFELPTTTQLHSRLQSIRKVQSLYCGLGHSDIHLNTPAYNI